MDETPQPAPAPAPSPAPQPEHQTLVLTDPPPEKHHTLLWSLCVMAVALTTGGIVYAYWQFATPIGETPVVVTQQEIDECDALRVTTVASDHENALNGSPPYMYYSETGTSHYNFNLGSCFLLLTSIGQPTPLAERYTFIRLFDALKPSSDTGGSYAPIAACIDEAGKSRCYVTDPVNGRWITPGDGAAGNRIRDISRQEFDEIVRVHMEEGLATTSGQTAEEYLQENWNVYRTDVQDYEGTSLAQIGVLSMCSTALHDFQLKYGEYTELLSGLAQLVPEEVYKSFCSDPYSSQLFRYEIIDGGTDYKLCAQTPIGYYCTNEAWLLDSSARTLE